jgi:hypothetical protein
MPLGGAGDEGTEAGGDLPQEAPTGWRDAQRQGIGLHQPCLLSSAIRASA